MTGPTSQERQRESTPWMDDAACKGKAQRIFFPERSSITGIGDPTAVAKAICAECPVKAECLSYALRHNERWGVWGGCSERERRYMLRRLRREMGLTRNQPLRSA